MSEQQKAPAFGAVMDMVPGMDGKTWPRLQIMAGTTAYVVTLPAEKFEQFINLLNEAGHEVLAQVKEANSPIKPVTPAEMAKIKHSNGYGKHR